MSLYFGFNNTISDCDNPFPSIQSWLLKKIEADNCEGYHRIHDNYYNLKEFIHLHPGGDTWINITKHNDITELFESSHLNINKVNVVLKKYLVTDIKPSKPRNTSTFTFNKDGFYYTLRSRAYEVLKHKGANSSIGMYTVHSIYLSLFLIFILLSLIPIEDILKYINLSSYLKLYSNIIFSIISGIFLALLANCSHNYFHQADNWRMYCFDITGFSSYEWRVSHCYSHHTYPNTINDFEQNALKKILNYYPINNKYNTFRYYFLPITANIGFILAIPLQIIRRYIALLTKKIEFRFEYILNLILLIISISIRYILLSNGILNIQLIYNSICYVLSSFLISILTCSWMFSTIGLAAGHHHPNIWHAGDDTCKSTTNNINNNIDNIDWGLFQLSAVGERPSLDSNLFLSSSSFGRHLLHHLFPTVDHSKLNLLLPILKSTCSDFNVKYFNQISNKSQIPTENTRYLSNFSSWIGMWLQAYSKQPSHRNYITFNSKLKKF